MRDVPKMSIPDILDVLKQFFPKYGQLIQTIVSVLVVLWFVQEFFSRLKSFWDWISSLFYKAEDKRRLAQRRRFADHVESEIRRLNNLEAWSDYRFAELEAEVEAEGRQRVYGILPILRRTRSGLRREKSLSRALETSQERLILVEGEPGSGKSVALRHVAQSMAHRAMRARTVKQIVPIYVNLKELKPDKGEVVDRNLIQSFVLRSLNRANDRDIEEFLESEFGKGLQEGTWLFLFDSFDEIPDVLSSTEADAIIRKYSDAISDFLHGLNLCRGIVASRQFRGPGQSGWPRFRILQLSEKKREELVQKADLGSDLQTTIVGQLGIAGDEIRGMTSNPMFLGLLCEYMRAGNPFPQNAHSVFEAYVETRLNRDEERLQRRFKLKPGTIRATAEQVAFCMAADSGLGLTPTRQNIAKAMKKFEFRVARDFDSQLDALEYIKLARSETATAAGDSKPFTFAHRRFQEYFATCVVLREPKRVAPKLLLTDARWRETAVVICQTQPAEQLLPIFKEARKVLSVMKRSVLGLIDDPSEYIKEMESGSKDVGKLSVIFPWPAGLLHLAGLLQDSFSNRFKELPEDIRLEISRVLFVASKDGTLSDRKWALEVAGAIPTEILLWMLRDAFASGSQWLSEVAFRQTARLSEIPEDIAHSIRMALVGLFTTGRLRRERHATHAHLARLDKPSSFLDSLQLLLWSKPVEFFTLSFLLASLLYILMRETNIILFAIGFGALILWIVGSYATLPLYGDFYMVLTMSPLQRLRTTGNLRFGFSFFVVYLQAVSVFFVLSGLDANLSVKLILFLLFLWSRFAIAAAITGQFVQPIWWVVMSLWPVFYIFRNARKALSAFWVWLQKNWIRLIWTVILIVPLLSITVLVFAILFPVIFLISFMSLLVTPIFLFLDWGLWRRQIGNTAETVTIQHFHQVISRFRFNWFRNRYIKMIRGQDLFVANHDAESYLIQLAIAVENALNLQKAALEQITEEMKKGFWRTMAQGGINVRTNVARLKNNLLTNIRINSVVDVNLPNFIEVWQKEYEGENKGRLATWGYEFLDEVWKLSEQVRANRKDK